MIGPGLWWNGLTPDRVQRCVKKVTAMVELLLDPNCPDQQRAYIHTIIMSRLLGKVAERL